MVFNAKSKEADAQTIQGNPPPVVRQSDIPSNPIDGLLWYDTQAEVLKQYKNGSFQTVGNSIDKDTIQKNANGQIEVGYPFKINLLDLSNGQGDWTVTREDNNSSGTATATFKPGYVEFDANQTGGFTDIRATIEATKDLSDIDEINVNIPFVNFSSDATTTAIEINNNVEISISEISSPQTLTVDTTSYGKNAVIEIYINAVVSGDLTFRIDNIESAEKTLPLTTKFRGAGN